MWQGLGMRAVDGHDVEAGIPGSQDRVDVVFLDCTNVVEVHLATAPHELKGARDLRWSASWHTALLSCGVWTAMPNLDGRERTLLVDHVAHQTQVTDVALIPEPGADAVRVVALGGDRAILGGHRSPAPLGFHSAEVRLEPRSI